MADARVMVLLGTRPEAIKLAPLIVRLRETPGLQPVVVATGQHRHMLDQVLDVFAIEPDVDLDVGTDRQTLEHITARVVSETGDLLHGRHRPEALVVQGDTTSAMAAALAGFYRSVPVVHLEAGLRTGDLSAPFPEEANRKIITQVASLHLAPTQTNRANLLGEGVADDDVAVTGNTVIDALLWTVRSGAGRVPRAVESARAEGRRIVTVTTHRRESWGPRMKGVAFALRRLVDEFDDVVLVLPLHLNPAVREVLTPVLDGHPRIVLTEPLPYPSFCRLMAESHLVITDSGGVQEEAPSLGVPVLVLREVTERPEAVLAGAVRVVGTDAVMVLAEARRLLGSSSAHAEMATAVNPYGDGHAAPRATAAIEQLLGVGRRIPDFSALPA